MHFDKEGHVIVTPREIHEQALADRARLINTVLLPGTPRAVPSHARCYELLHYISEEMGIHPNNLFFKGSTKIGFTACKTRIIRYRRLKISRGRTRSRRRRSPTNLKTDPLSGFSTLGPSLKAAKFESRPNVEKQPIAGSLDIVMGAIVR